MTFKEFSYYVGREYQDNNMRASGGGYYDGDDFIVTDFSVIDDNNTKTDLSPSAVRQAAEEFLTLNNVPS